MIPNPKGVSVQGTLRALFANLSLLYPTHPHISALLILCGQLGVVNAGSLERFRSASVRQPPSLHGESIDLEGAQDESTGARAESLPKPSFFRNLTLRLKSRRAGYDILEKPSLSPDLKSAAIAAFDRIYQDHSKLGLKYEAIDDYKTIEHHS
ncbi:hypothetical protein KEM48_001386 [Puccinia striiformis f. sp. tritici PST-130]|nr:hypothetical protein KEM48_001386 [Puccinia striiformis f. sp. tritici PST-130]